MNSKLSSNYNYPKHKYSKYIDPKMSFSNVVSYPSKSELVDALKNVRCSGGIMLEPRLQEYLKKKKYYKDNKIEPCISLESEFQITEVDMNILKAFLKGARDMYTPHNIAFSEYNDNSKKQKPSFPSKQLRLMDDPRVQKINKQNKDRPKNMGMFVPDSPGEYFYEDPIKPIDGILDARDLRSKSDITGFNIDDSRYEPRIDPYMDRGTEKYNKNDSQYRIPSGFDPKLLSGKSLDNLFDGPYKTISKSTVPKRDTKKVRQCQDYHGSNTSYKTDIGNNHDRRRSNKIELDQLGQLDLSTLDPKSYRILGKDGKNGLDNKRYGKIENPLYSDKMDMDLDSRVVVPKLSTRDRRSLSTSDYIFEPFNENDMRDADFESSLLRGMPSNTRKSYGYRNPEEHYFQYIEDDFQNADNSVEPYPRGGEGTRMINKSMANQKNTREIL